MVGRCVPKTLDLGTTTYQLDTLGKAPKNVFINRIRKPVFRLNSAIGFSEHIA